MRCSPKLAAPGAFNHDDESPCVDGEPSEEAVQGDTRSQGQRNHDALNAIGRSVLAPGELGKHNGLPATIVVVRLLALNGGALYPMTPSGLSKPEHLGQQQVMLRRPRGRRCGLRPRLTRSAHCSSNLTAHTLQPCRWSCRCCG